MSRDYEISECTYRRIEITNSTCTRPRRRTPNTSANIKDTPAHIFDSGDVRISESFSIVINRNLLSQSESYDAILAGTELIRRSRISLGRLMAGMHILFPRYIEKRLIFTAE